MTSKERVLQREKERGKPVGRVHGKADALDLAQRAANMEHSIFNVFGLVIRLGTGHFTSAAGFAGLRIFHYQFFHDGTSRGL